MPLVLKEIKGEHKGAKNPLYFAKFSVICYLLFQMPLVLKEIEAKTEEPGEKTTVSKILQMKELSLSKSPTLLRLNYIKCLSNGTKGFSLFEVACTIVCTICTCTANIIRTLFFKKFCNLSLIN